MTDDFIHWSQPYPPLSSTCDQILSWMFDIWVKRHSVSDSDCNTANLQLEGMTNNVGLTFSDGDVIPRIKISIEQDTRIGDTKYHI